MSSSSSSSTSEGMPKQQKMSQQDFLDAATEGNLVKVKEGIEQGVDKEAKSNEGLTALHFASENGHLEIVKYFETCHVDKEAKDNRGRTALHCASRKGLLEIVKYLIEACNVDMEAKLNIGWTALHCATCDGRLEVVKYLIETCHVDNEAIDNGGQTAYDLSMRNVAEYFDAKRNETSSGVISDNKLKLNPEYPEQIKRGLELIESIMKDYEDIPGSEEMKMLRNAMILETGESIDVVIRSIIEDFWQTVIEATDHSRVCAVGTPGIGKTSSTCILLRLLLIQQKTVLYRVRTNQNGFIYMFTHTSEGLTDVKVFRENDFDRYDENINQLSTYYIVDPGKTKDDCNLPDDFRGKVIIVASPDERHWGASEFVKRRGRNSGGTRRYLPVWTLPELMEALPVFGTCDGVSLGLTKEDIKDRFQRFGGVPRYVFASRSAYEDQLSAQDEALEALSENDAMRLAYKNRSAIQTHSWDLQKGILLSYIRNPKEKGYQNAYAVFSSDFVYDSIVG